MYCITLYIIVTYMENRVMYGGSITLCEIVIG